MGRFLTLTTLLLVATTGLAQTYTVKNNCPAAIDLHVGNLPVESLNTGATTVKTGLGPLAEFYTTTNNGVVDGRFVGAKAGFYLIPNFWAYYIGRNQYDYFNTGISITPSVPEHDGFCPVAECTNPATDGNNCSDGYPTLDQWNFPPGPDDGPIGPPIFQCKDANVDFTITFCPNGQWPNRPSQLIKPVADQSKCLDVQGAVFENGTPVQLYDCNGTAAQNWVVSTGLARKTIRLAGTNFCLDAGDNPAAPTGSKMKIWTCYDFLMQQQFTYSSGTADGHISMSQPYKFSPSFCLDVTDGRFENSNQVQMWDCADNSANQRWIVQ